MGKRRKKDVADDVTKQLDLFLKRGEEMWRSRARRDGFNVSLKLDWNREKGDLSTQLKEPDLDDLRSYLLTFRRFISNDSPVFIGKIFKLLHPRIEDETIRAYLAEARAEWLEIEAGKGKGATISITVDGQTLTTREIVDAWINGHYFHDDQTKIELLEKMAPYQLQVSRAIFLDYVIETTKVIRYLAQTIVTARLRGDMKC